MMIRHSNLNWPERIELAIKNGFFTEEDIELARQWNQCAIGEQYLIMEDSGAEVVNTLKQTRRDYDYDINLGDEFMVAVRDQDVGLAAKTYKQIVDRVQGDGQPT